MTAYKKRGILTCPFCYLRPSTAQPVNEQSLNTHAGKVYNTPKSVREGTVRPLHTPGVYTTPVAFISAVALDWFICIVEVSDSQKQSINDAFQYVAVPPIPPGDVGMNDAKIQKSLERKGL